MIQQVINYYDPTKPSLRHTHYYLLTITLLIAFTFFPSLLLLLYPIKCLRRFLYIACCRCLHCIQAFADTFQGYYKDGTEGTRDYRSMTSLQFIYRMVLNCNRWFATNSSWNEIRILDSLVCMLPHHPASYMNITEGILLYSIVAALSVLIITGIIIYPEGYIEYYI